MKKIERVYLVGLGAIGCSYASKLYELDPNILKIIASEERIEKYSKNGILINEKTFIFNYLRPEEEAIPADLIIVSVKQHHLNQAISDMKGFVGPNTIILSLLNGISSEEIISNALGLKSILNAFCVGTDAVRLGTDTSFSKVGTIVFGDKSNDSTLPQVIAISELFEKAKIPYTVPNDIIREQWWKFMMNVGINQVSAVLKAPYGVFSSSKDAADLIYMASMEVVQIANALGINLVKEDIQKYIDILHTLSPNGKTSMLQDIEAKRKTEVEMFAGTVSSFGKKYGIATPINDMLFKMIRTLELMNQ